MNESDGDRHIFVVFGGTGDLMERKLLPAIFHLLDGGLIQRDQSIILGVARSKDHNDESIRKWAREVLHNTERLSEDLINKWCDSNLYFQSIGHGKDKNYKQLAERIAELEEAHNLPGNRIFYLALPPVAFEPTITGLGNAGLNTSSGWTRLVIEKPFGRDLESAQALNEVVHNRFNESQIYRIDHYLGKETVQNLLVFRFANSIFESLWNRDRIESIQISVAEDLGVGHRADYYDKAGALRDMVQNHLTQLLTLIAMEVPTAFEADAIRSEKIKVLKSVVPLEKDRVVLGQYTKGKVNGQAVAGYLDELGGTEQSNTETFVAMRMEIANWRWQGVPFYLRTGKRMPRRSTKIVVRFRHPPVSVFHPYNRCTVTSNALIITLQPNEGFDLQFEVKSPGEPLNIETKHLDFRYADEFEPLPDAYRTLLLDVIQGDQTLFVHGNEVEESWKLYTPLLKRDLPIYSYEAGTWGPDEIYELPKRLGEQWLNR